MRSLEPLDRDGADLYENVLTLIERRVAVSPGKVAVVARDRDLTYGELTARANSIARRLLDEGLDAEEPVAVLMERRADLVAALMGVWRAGGAYVPIDPEDPPKRVRQLMEQSGCGRLLGDKRLTARLELQSDAPAPIDIQAIDFGASAALPSIPSDGARLAYLLFTSGSTGAPKAAEIEHRSVSNLLLDMRRRLRIVESDRYLAASTVAFDISVAELFLPLISGASLLLRDRKDLLDPRRLAEDIRENGVTILQTGPAVWSVLLEEAPDLPRLRVAITTGEAVTPRTAKRLLPYADEVWNLYGPTEATIWATGYRLTDEILDDGSETYAPIGAPVAGLTAHVVRADGAPVDADEQGELYLAGIGLARGYRGNPALTAERFATWRGERVYRTGDLVSRDEAGTLSYFGRNDEQLKIRGLRVEPGEIEAALVKCPGVVRAAATWFEAAPSGRAIVAAVVRAPGASCSASDLHAALGALLPAQMIPARFLFAPQLPVTVNGKIDRAAIREAASAPATVEAVSGTAEASTQTEEEIARIWRRMLRLAQVSPDDHFLAIGGDSLAAVQMMVEVESRLGVQLPMQLIFQAPTLGEFARRVEAHRMRRQSLIADDFVFPLVDTPYNATALFFSQTDLSIARRWTVSCPLYEMSFWAKGSGFILAESLEQLAASYLDRVRKIQPKGPYRLAGCSLGGLIAYEMAQQLRQQGEVVEMLFLLDPMGPMNAEVRDRDWRPAPRNPIGYRLQRHLRAIMRGPRRLGFRIWFSKLVPLYKLPGASWATYHLAHLLGRHPNPVSLALLPRDLWHAYWYAAQRLARTYVARPYDGPGLAVFAERGSSGEVWAPLLGPAITARRVRADHDHLFEEPAVSEWMGWLGEALKIARKG